jgi:hypothetical protein
MQKYAEHALTSEYAKIYSIQFWYLINQVKICEHSLTACVRIYWWKKQYAFYAKSGLYL